MNINAVATDSGLAVLRDHIKDKVKKFVVLGDASTENTLLDNIINNYASTYGQIKDYIIYEGIISKAYYDKQGILTFDLALPYQNDLEKYVYGLGLVDSDNKLVSISKTPKFIKSGGIGGTFVYKVAITGEAGKIIFADDEGAIFATDKECTEGNVRNRAIDPYQLKRATVAKAGRLETVRNINGIAFDGTKDITIKAEANGGNADTVGGKSANELIMPIGTIFPVAVCWGVPKPDNSSSYKFIELTHSSEYNKGLFSSELIADEPIYSIDEEGEKITYKDTNGNLMLSVLSTAVISCQGSPLDGKTIRLINTEKRYLRASSEAGKYYNDAIRRITGYIAGHNYGNHTGFGAGGGAFTLTSPVPTGAAPQLFKGSHAKANFDTRFVVPAADDNRPKTIEMTYFMRIL